MDPPNTTVRSAPAEPETATGDDPRVSCVHEHAEQTRVVAALALVIVFFMFVAQGMSVERLAAAAVVFCGVGAVVWLFTRACVRE